MTDVNLFLRTSVSNPKPMIFYLVTQIKYLKSEEIYDNLILSSIINNPQLEMFLLQIFQFLKKKYVLCKVLKSVFSDFCNSLFIKSSIKCYDSFVSTLRNNIHCALLQIDALLNSKTWSLTSLRSLSLSECIKTTNTYPCRSNKQNKNILDGYNKISKYHRNLECGRQLR